MPAVVRREFVKWCNRGNPASGYQMAAKSREMMTEFRRAIGKIAGVSVCCPEARDGGTGGAGYKVIFTSGASESNATVLSHFCARGGRNHVIASAIEHKSVLDHLNSARDRGAITLSLVRPRSTGEISPEDIRAQLRPDTTLVCVMHANNETGVINDVAAIGAIARGAGAHFHCDTAQTFGKIAIPGAAMDSFVVSFHKIHGPPGCGALVVHEPMMPLIYGTQNEKLRGGTENLPGIAASYCSTLLTVENRAAKNRHRRVLRQYIVRVLSRVIPVVKYSEYKPPARNCIVIFGGTNVIPGTLLLSLVSPTANICNVELKKKLESRGIIVSIGSACNTSSKSASHVLDAFGADQLVKRGTLRVSIGDGTTFEDVKKFVTNFIIIADKMLRA